jgi:hypothetical protein
VKSIHEEETRRPEVTDSGTRYRGRRRRGRGQKGKDRKEKETEKEREKGARQEEWR